MPPRQTSHIPPLPVKILHMYRLRVAHSTVVLGTESPVFMHVQLFSHMHGVEASGAVGLFVRTKVIIPNFTCHDCARDCATKRKCSTIFQ